MINAVAPPAIGLGREHHAVGGIDLPPLVAGYVERNAPPGRVRFTQNGEMQLKPD